MSGPLPKGDLADGGGKLPLLATVALLRDLQEGRLRFGQVGVVVEILDEATALVEFCDGQGLAFAVEPCPFASLRLLRTSPLAG